MTSITLVARGSVSSEGEGTATSQQMGRSKASSYGRHNQVQTGNFEADPVISRKSSLRIDQESPMQVFNFEDPMQLEKW